MIECTDSRLDGLMRDLHESRMGFMEEGNTEYARLIDCIRDNIMRRHFPDCFKEVPANSGKEDG